MSVAMVEAIRAAFAAVEADPGVRIVLLRGAGGHFCAGGDVADMAEAAGAAPDPAAPPLLGDPIAAMNRRFGAMLGEVERSRAAVVAVCEGAVMGGGFGLACVADVTIVVEGAQFRLPETGLGLVPAQIAPYVVRRVGLSHGRRLAVTGEALSAAEALALGLAHRLVPAADALPGVLDPLLAALRRCEPEALAATKRLVLSAAGGGLDAVLDEAASTFASFARSDRAQAGFAAFLSRQPPPWARDP